MCSFVYLIISQTPGRLKCSRWPLRAPHLFVGLMTNLVLVGSWIFDMRTDFLHCSMCLTPLFLYLLIMLTRQIRCNSTGSRESVEEVNRIAEKLRNVDTDCMLYTPTLADFKQNCSRSTLACFALELKVLSVEIQSVSKNSQKLLRILNNMMNQSKDNMEPCPDCELYREKRAETFLESLQNILQWMNALQGPLRDI